MIRTKQLATFGAAVMTTLLALVVLWQFRAVVGHVLISVALAAALRPLVNRLVGRSLAVRAAWILLYLVVLVGLGFLLLQAGETAIGEIRLLAQTVATQDEWRLPVWLRGSAFQHVLVARLPSPSKLFEAATGEEGQHVLPTLLGFTQGVGGVLSGAFVILFLSVYWSINQGHFERLWLSLLHPDQRQRARGIWRTIEQDLGSYIRSELAQSLVAAVLLGLGCWLLGSSYPILLAVIGALAWLIPVVGAPLAVVLPLLLGLLTSVQLGLVTALYAAGVLIALQVWVEPRFFRRPWDNPLLTLVILLAMADAFGLLGMLVAPPLSAACQILWSRLFSHRPAAGAATRVSDLRERQERVSAVISAMEEPPPPLVTSGMERLAQLLAKAEPILPAEPAEPVVGPAPQAGQEEHNGRTQQG